MAFYKGHTYGLHHGHALDGAKSRTYQSWTNMIQRCKTDPKYKDITVCARWQVFAHFLADMGERPTGTSLDRRDGTKGYSKENCRWATPTEQRKNQNAPRGNRARYHHLSKEDFQKIFWMQNTGATQQQISETLDIPIGIVGRVWRGERTT